MERQSVRKADGERDERASIVHGDPMLHLVELRARADRGLRAGPVVLSVDPMTRRLALGLLVTLFAFVSARGTATADDGKSPAARAPFDAIEKALKAADE